MTALDIFCNHDFPAAAKGLLESGIAGHRLIGALAEADVALGQPDVAGVVASPRLRWTQLTSAGYTNYDRDDLRAAFTARGAALTKSSLVFDQPCAEHIVALMFAQARQLPAALAEQRGARGWPQKALRSRSRLLRGQSVVIAGLGSIARLVIGMLAPLRMEVTVLRRRVAGDEPAPAAAWDSPEATRAFGAADHVLNVLPAAPGTDGFFNAARLALVKPGAIFYNIGRGNTVDQPALIAALTSGRLGAAYLDVATPEPLPPDHPLWTAPNCFITPHTAGGHEDESLRLVRHFLDNLARFAAGRALLDRVL
ncbi:MAG TPA: D-2-hydroxyacid dehydrogenase [Polyangia bacterium]|nr:D-2-hydroxyacid dehydrogenase [Polyangia bacterium]